MISPLEQELREAVAATLQEGLDTPWPEKAMKTVSSSDRSSISPDRCVRILPAVGKRSSFLLSKAAVEVITTIWFLS